MLYNLLQPFLLLPFSLLPTLSLLATSILADSPGSCAIDKMSSEKEQQGLNGMDLIIDGWFHERGALWPGQAMSLQVKEVLYHGRSKFQDVLVFVSFSLIKC